MEGGIYSVVEQLLSWRPEILGLSLLLDIATNTKPTEEAEVEKTPVANNSPFFLL